MLPCITFFDKALGIMECRQSVETLPKGLGDEGSTAGVVATCPFVDVLQDGDAVFWCDASLEDA
jgi:hypothetical protein